MEGIVKKYQQKFRKVKEEMNRWNEIQSKLVSQFNNASAIIERLQIVQNRKNYGALKCIDGIEEMVLRKQMESLETILLSTNKTIEEFHGVVRFLEKSLRDGRQLVNGGSINATPKMIRQRIGIKPSLADCLDGFSLLCDMYHSEYLLKSSIVSALSKQALKPNGASDLSSLQQLLVDQPNITKEEGTFDPELRLVLDLATDTELYELQNILFGPSYFSPLLKSITKPVHVDHFMVGEDLEKREDFIEILESRFLFLAADARSTLRGWRPSYRNVLLGVREKLNVSCSRNLSTEDLEAEIFLYLLQEYSSNESGTSATSKIAINQISNQNSLELGLDKWKVQAVAAIKVGATEINEIFLKGGGMLTLVNIYRLFAKKLSGSMFLEAANYQIKKEIVSKGGKLAAVNLESRVALLAAKQVILIW